MNQDATLAQMRELKLAGMAQAFEALCLLPIDKQPASEQLLTQLLEAEELYRKNRKQWLASNWPNSVIRLLWKKLRYLQNVI